MFNLQRVLIADDIDQSCIDILNRAGVQPIVKTKLTKEQLLDEVKVRVAVGSNVEKQISKFLFCH